MLTDARKGFLKGIDIILKNTDVSIGDLLTKLEDSTGIPISELNDDQMLILLSDICTTITFTTIYDTTNKFVGFIITSSSGTRLSEIFDYDDIEYSDIEIFLSNKCKCFKSNLIEEGELIFPNLEEVTIALQELKKFLFKNSILVVLLSEINDSEY